MSCTQGRNEMLSVIASGEMHRHAVSKKSGPMRFCGARFVFNATSTQEAYFHFRNHENSFFLSSVIRSTSLSLPANGTMPYNIDEYRVAAFYVSGRK